MEVYIFLEGISLKENVIVQLEFELTYFGAAVQYFSHCTMGISHHKKNVSRLKLWKLIKLKLKKLKNKY